MGAIFKEKSIEGISKLLGDDMLSTEDKKKFLEKVEVASTLDGRLSQV